MKIDLHWHKPCELQDGTNQNLIYEAKKLEKIPKKSRIYVFARKFGKEMIPLYVGQANDLRKRIDQQLTGNVPLMMAIKNSPSGKRSILISEFHSKPGQQKDKALNLLEQTFIEHSLGQGYELLNIQGTKTPVDTIKSSGKRRYHSPFPRRMNVKRK